MTLKNGSTAYKAGREGVVRGSNGVEADKMGKEGGEEEKRKKPRVMCLHGLRTSGEILKQQLKKWPESVLGKLDLVFVDAPLPACGKSDVEGFFPPPYYEWFRFNKEGPVVYEKFDECLEYIEELMIKHGPFDGLLGFSQGALLSAALPGLQMQRLALTKVPEIKFLVIIGGGTFASRALNEKAYLTKIRCPSIHFIGINDFLVDRGTELLKSFEDYVVIHHSKGHTVPRLDEKNLETMNNFLEMVGQVVSGAGAGADAKEKDDFHETS